MNMLYDITNSCPTHTLRMDITLKEESQTKHMFLCGTEDSLTHYCELSSLAQTNMTELIVVSSSKQSPVLAHWLVCRHIMVR